MECIYMCMDIYVDIHVYLYVYVQNIINYIYEYIVKYINNENFLLHKVSFFEVVRSKSRSSGSQRWRTLISLY